MSGKYALIIGNTEYTDPGLAQLTAPGKDAEDFTQVLKLSEYGGFDSVTTLINSDSASTKEAIEEFFNEKTKGDLLLLYFSGHGVKDEVGRLYLAVRNTNRSKLRSTAIESDFVRDAMSQSRSKRQVLNSGLLQQRRIRPRHQSGDRRKRWHGFGIFSRLWSGDLDRKRFHTICMGRQ